MELERALRRVMISASGGNVIFGIRFSDREYFLERLSRRPPVLDKWAEERVKEEFKRSQI